MTVKAYGSEFKIALNCLGVPVFLAYEGPKIDNAFAYGFTIKLICIADRLFRKEI